MQRVVVLKPGASGIGQAASANAAEDDSGLLARIGKGDEAAFSELVGRHVGALSALARRMLGNDADAEDVTQEAFLRLWRGTGAVEFGDAGARPWLRRVVSNLCIDRIRRGRRVEVTDEPPEVPDPPRQFRELEELAVKVRVDAALQALPERQRMALVLFHYDGLSQIEVAAEMGISDEAVESLLARGRRSLRTRLDAEWRELVARDDGV